MKRYCNHCASALDAASEENNCPGCGRPYAGNLADDFTVPKDTLVLEPNRDPGLVPEATTVFGPVVGPDAAADSRPDSPPMPDSLPALDIDALRAGLAGRFEVHRMVGAGGMGQVFEATDLTLQRKVAIKCITPLLSTRPEWVERLRHEARIVARLQHPNIVQIYEVIDLAGHSLMVMEFVAGKDLRSAVRDVDLDRTELLELIGEACEAVGFAHRRGVIHRDIKPGNIMVSADQHCKIMDFGIAGLIDDASESGHSAVAGSLGYMAPELVAGNGPGDTRTDVYALGVTIYFALTGNLPFRGARGTQLTARIREGRPTPPRRYDTSITLDLEAVCLKALSREREGRYAGCDELGADLRRARCGLPVSARRYPLPVQLGRAVVLHPLPFALALGTAVLLFAGIFLSASHVHKVAEGTTVSELEDKVRNVGFALTVLMPGDQVAALRTAPRANPADYAFLDTAIRSIKDFNPDIRDAYLVLPERPGRYRVGLAWHGSHNKGHASAPAMPATGAPRGHDTWGNTSAIDNAIAVGFIGRSLAGEILVQHERDTDASAGNEWRDRLLGYAPIRGRDGDGVAVLVIEVSSEALITALRQIERAFRLTLLFGGLLSVGVLVLALTGLVLIWRQSP